MWTYQPPLRDMRFVIEEVLRAPSQWPGMPAFAELDADTSRQIAEEAGRFASEVLAPTNQSGDLEGCRFDAGSVQTPAGFREAYRSFVDAGWPSLACAPEAGGQGLPQLLNAVLYEMLSSANQSWTMYPALLQGAYDCLHANASAELKAAYLPKIVSGEWLSTMCLTEAHAGSDLGMLRTKAVPQADGSHALSGTKIFISGGEHDLSENIVHLVLARIADAPSGTKGLSLFLVPKRIPRDGGLAANAVRCDGIEKKMGVKGSATCVMNFEGATGWLIGEPNHGLAAMFVMMNASRLLVGMQGLAQAEAAWQNAMRYAAERMQLRAVRPPEADAASGQRGPADPIIWHAAMRRTLLSQRARLEGARLLAYESAHLLDVAAHAADDAQRQRAQDLVALLTPVAKAFISDNGFNIASRALQVYGGHGYVHDYGIEQCVRDSRIAMIYEGTNEIQAIDLLVRKVVADGGQRFGAMLDWLEQQLPAEGARHGARVRSLIGEVRAAASGIVAASSGDPELPYRVADDFLYLVGLLLLAQGWARADAAAEAALQGAAGEAFHATKRETAAHFFAFVLPEARLRLELIGAGRDALPFVKPA